MQSTVSFAPCAPRVLSISGAGQPVFPRGGAGWGGASIPGDYDCNTCGNDGISDGDCDDDNHHQQQQQPPKLGRHLLYQIQ